jgi:hypothetical protein
MGKVLIEPLDQSPVLDDFPQNGDVIHMLNLNFLTRAVGYNLQRSAPTMKI